MSVTDRLGLTTRSSRSMIDYHPTPSCAVQALLDNVTFKGKIWEPACGDGAISRFLKNQGYKVKSSDIQKHKSVYGQGGVDFLKSNTKYDNIITNPPYKHLNAFIERGLKTSGKKLALLVNNQAIWGINKYELYTNHPPSLVLILTKAIPFFGKSGKWERGGMHHVWLIWDKFAKKETKMVWVLNSNQPTDLDLRMGKRGMQK